jgi:hypothetical protein
LKKRLELTTPACHICAEDGSKVLPDFPETKRLFARFFQHYMRRRASELSPFGMIQARYLHEGRGMKIMRADQTESDSRMIQLSTQMEIKFAEIENLTLEAVIQKYDEVILDMVRKQADFIRERLGSEIPACQTLEAKGRKFDAQIVLELLEKMHIEFHPDGTPHELYLDGPLFTPDRMAAVQKEFENSPELQRKHEELIARKREEWRAREADRKLVG